jgi:hypothetical protein
VHLIADDAAYPAMRELAILREAVILRKNAGKVVTVRFSSPAHFSLGMTLLKNQITLSLRLKGSRNLICTFKTWTSRT